MKSPELSRQIQRLRALFDRVHEAGIGNFDLESHWAQYLCVLAGGLLENALKEIYSDFIGRASSPPVARYATRQLALLKNPKIENVRQLAGGFKDVWLIELDNFLEENGRRDAIDSLINNRHQIAHGKYTSLTLGRLREYLTKTIEVLEFLEAQCLAR